MLKRFLAYYKPHKKLFCMDMSASLIVAMLGIVYPIVTRRMLNDLIPNRQYQSIVLSGLLLLVIYLIRMGLNYFIQYQGHMMGVKMQAQMRRICSTTWKSCRFPSTTTTKRARSCPA